MSTNTAVGDGELNDVGVETRVYTLSVELAEQERLKKSSMQAFNEEIKRIKAEIKELINDQLEQETEAEEGQEPI